LTTLREKLIKIGRIVVRHSRKIVFQMAEVAGAARVVPDDFGTDWTAEICNCDVRMSKSERNHMKTTANNGGGVSSPGENGIEHKMASTTSRAGKKQVAELKK